MRSKALLFVWKGAACFGLRVALRWGFVSPALNSYSPDNSAPGPQHAFARERPEESCHVVYPREFLPTGSAGKAFREDALRLSHVPG